MAKADTPAPAKKEEKKTTTPPGTDTPAEKPKEKPTPPTPQEQKVVELEAEVERLGNLLGKQETITKTSQRIAAQNEKKMKGLQEILRGIRSGEINPDEINIPAEVTPSEQEVLLKDIKFGVQDLIIGNPDYQELLKKDITLKEVLRKNPAVLIGDYFDSGDAVGQIKEKLDEKVKEMKASQPKEDKPDKKEGEPVEFEPGPTQPTETPETPKKEEGPGVDKVEESIKDKINIV